MDLARDGLTVMKLPEKDRMVRLLDTYGALLTPRQMEMLDLYCNEDLSYGEIAEIKQVSRQAVHDALQQARKTLEHFEEHLGLIDRPKQNSQHTLVGEDARGEVNRLLRDLHVRLQDDILYDTGPLRKIVERLRKLLNATES